MIPDGVELIVGMERDPQFGPAVLVGLGGVLAEVLDDVAIRLAPVIATAAREMLDELRGRAVARRVSRRAGRRSGRALPVIVAVGRLGRRTTGHRRDRPQPGHRAAPWRDVVDALVVLDG